MRPKAIPCEGEEKEKDQERRALARSQIGSRTRGTADGETKIDERQAQWMVDVELRPELAEILTPSKVFKTLRLQAEQPTALRGTVQCRCASADGSPTILPSCGTGAEHAFPVAPTDRQTSECRTPASRSAEPGTLGAVARISTT